MASRWGKNGNGSRFYFLGLQKSLQTVTTAMKLWHLLLGRKAMTNLYNVLKSWDITLTTNVCVIKVMVFPVQMWGLGHKEGWEPKNWCFWTVVLKKTLESPLDCKEIQPVHPKGNQSWMFIGRTDAEAETPILWPPDGTGWLLGKDPDAGKDQEKGATENEVVVCHHQIDVH